MFQPQQPSDAVPLGAGAPTPAWTPPAPEWVAQTPAWPTPTTPAPGTAPAVPPGRTGSPVAAAAVGAAVLSVGVLLAALVSALLLSSVLAGRADEVGRGIGSALGESMTEQTGALLGAGSLGGGYGYGPVEQTDPVPPGTLGADVTLDGYAQECFAGDHDACDQLYLQSAPFSEYERYGSTCGGRVKPPTVASCTELD